MYFNSTYFHNFRNLQSERRVWPQGLNLIVGPNGSGKTNFLEGLNIASGWGPLEKGTKIPDLVRWSGEPKERDTRASLWANVRGEEEAEIFASLTSRCSLKCSDKTSGAAEMRARIPVLSFLSGNMALLKGGASHRRQLMDRVGSLISPSYALHLHHYRKALRQKAVLLRRCANPLVAERAMMPHGAWIWTAREEIVRMLFLALENFSDLLPRHISLTYRRGGGGTTADPASDLKQSLCAKREKERASRLALVGPQRDDIDIVCNDRQAALVLSRGQCRRIVSALILTSAHVVEKSLGRKPVLVFDEVASELDEEGRFAVLGALAETGCQVFAATADVIGHDDLHVHRMQDGKFI